MGWGRGLSLLSSEQKSQDVMEKDVGGPLHSGIRK